MLTRWLRLGLVLVLASCAKGASNGGSAEAARGALIARVGKVELREADIKRAMARDPGASRERFESAEARRELVDGLVRFELLAQAAERAGLTQDPDAIHALRQIAVTKLVNEALGEVAKPESISQADVEREYRRLQAGEFTLPEAAQIRHIRVADEKRAARVAEQARAIAPADDRAFAALATSASDDAATRASGGDLGFVDKSSRLPSALVAAALALKTPGEVAGPLATDQGYEILRLVSRRAAAVSPLSSVEEPIKQRLYRERRAKALDELIVKLRRETPVELLKSP
jgi:peptidyl-prolyl cis-trans isomerase C